MYRRIKLRHLLFISFILISILPVLSLAVWVQQTAYEKEIAAVTDKHLLLAKNITSALSRYVIDVEATFRYVSGGDIIASSSNALVDMLKLVEFRHICVIDSFGHVASNVSSLSQSSDEKSLSPALMSRLKKYFEQAGKTPSTVIFTDVIGNELNQPAIFLIRAKTNNRYAVGELSTEYIVDVAKAISFGKKGHSAIVDRTGHLLAHPNKLWRQQMKDVSKVSAVSKMMLGETGVETFFSPALKADMIAGYTTVPETGWGVMVPQPVAELEIRAKQVGEVMYYIVVLGLIFSGLISWLLARYISRPIQNVVQAVEQVSLGDYNAKIRDSVNVIPEELNVLTSSFNSMIDDLGDYENRLRHQASFDQLTNLPNRWLFIDRLEQAIGDALRQKTLVSLLFIDLDRFKIVNDTHGHEVGDIVLQQVATRLQRCIRETDTVARIGGDEFTIILAHLKNSQMATIVASKIIDAMSKPFIVDERECFLGASIGISISPTDSDDPEVLMKNGDIAMYQAKSSGRNTYRYFTDEMNIQVLRRAKIEHGLHGAIERDEITLHYQPIIEVTTKKVASVEVLMRWKNPQLGNVSPAEFISIAEENGMIKQLGEWMLLTACKQAKVWLDEGTLDFGISVNLSSREIPLGFSVASVENILNETGLPAHYLTFEITENLILDDTQEIQSLLCGMKALGVSLSIDDFGTGYSSFSYLTKFPFDIMKIDRAFTQSIADQEENSRLIEGMIALGKRLNLKVVAEGIETEAQFSLLQQFECDYAQGFYFTPALPASTLIAFIANQTPQN